MTVAEEKLQKAVSITLSAGFQLDKEAFQFLNMLAQTEDPTELMKAVIKKLETRSEKPLFIVKSHLEETTKELFARTAESSLSLTLPSEIQESKRTFHPLAKDTQSELEVLEDPTAKICATGSIEEYAQYFRNRFEKLQKLIKQRMDSRDALSIKAAFRATPNSKIKIILHE